MNTELREALEAELGQQLRSVDPVSGGDINDAYRVSLSDGSVVFVKSNPRLASRVFEVEARGLQWLAEAGALRIPRVLAVSNTESRAAFLVLEYLEPAARARGFSEDLGHGLAELHRFGAPSFGLDHDNFIGSLPQSNTPSERWSDFYREQRLAPQVKRALDQGRLDANTGRLFDRLYAQLDELVGPSEPTELPARLHGDLWGGNLHVGSAGEPCLIDPACYGGHREVDLAMMHLFGGFDARVFDAYAESYPLPLEHERRIPLYQLYPLLVHVNLFGGGYAQSVKSALLKLVG